MVETVIGRDMELSSIEGFLDRIRGGPSALVLSGEPGIGKTALWEVGVEAARERHDRVLTCHGVEAEASLAFAGLSELLARVLDEATPSLAPPRRRALEVALLLVEPSGRPPDHHAIGLAVLDVLHALAEHGTVLIALDDVQWLDAASAGVLQIAFRRLREEPVGLLATLRQAPEVDDPFDLDRSFPEEHLERLSIGPLTSGALHRLLAERLGLELTRPELARVQEATAGNPFFALELGRELVRTGSRPTPGQPLRVPDSLRELLGGRLARLPGETLDVLLQVAALARPTVEVVAAAHGERDPVLRGLEAAVDEGVVELDDTRIRFTHPLLASICYEKAPVWKRRAVHRALAGAVSDIEERARHLALAADGPDAAVAAELDAAAGRAAIRGATGVAAELCELAAELTPSNPPRQRERLLQAAAFHRLAGNTEQAAALLEQLLTEVPSGVERADILLALGWTFLTRLPTMKEHFDDALLNATGDDARLARILSLRSMFHLMSLDVPAALADARAALERAERVGDPVLIATAIARVGHVESWGAEITPGLLERGVQIEQQLTVELDFIESPSIHLGRQLMRRGEIDRPRTIFVELEAKAVARGDEVTRTLMLWYLSLVEWCAGRWQRALELVQTAHELGEQTQLAGSYGHDARFGGLIRADLGLVAEARASAERAVEHARLNGDEYFVIPSLGVLGRLELALGNLEAAARHLRDLPERLLAGGINDPGQPLWGDAIETLIAVGELDRARTYLEQFSVHAKNVGNLYAVAGAARCRGLLAAAEGDLAGAIAELEGAVDVLADGGFPVERGRALLCLGMVRRQAQQKRAAREALEQALVVFDELGARLWADKARAELKRIGGRRPAPDGLTDTEERISRMAADGSSNKEIASALFMSVRTVEAHLTSVYRKLDIRSRSGLANRLEPVAAEAGKPAVDAGET